MLPYRDAERVVDARERHRRADDGRDPAVLGDRDGDVHHVLPQRLAVADRPSRPPQQGGLELGPVAWFSIVAGFDSESASTLPLAAPGRSAAMTVMRVPDALAEPLQERLELLRRVGRHGRDDLLAHEGGARLQLGLGVVEVEVAHRAHRVEPDRGRAEDDDDEVGGVEPPEQARPAHASLVLEAVADAADRLDVRAAAAELAAQRHDVDVDRAVGHEAVADEESSALRGVDDLVPGEHPARRRLARYRRMRNSVAVSSTGLSPTSTSCRPGWMVRSRMWTVDCVVVGLGAAAQHRPDAGERAPAG